MSFNYSISTMFILARKNKQALSAALIISILAMCLPAIAEDEIDFDKKGGPKRPCTNTLKLFIDDEEQWEYSLFELRNLDIAVVIDDKRTKGKKVIPFAALLDQADNVTNVEVSTCTGKLRRFDTNEIAKKRDSLYFIITGYRGLKLYNAAGESGNGEKKEKRRKRKGTGLKSIDQIRLITQPE
jgi:hypothetical protein